MMRACPCKDLRSKGIIDMAVCSVCFRHCDIKEGAAGFCGARTCENGTVRASNYGRITSLALDPIEKKPLRRFYPGSVILSVGSFGCNLRCPFCQNSGISWSEEAFRLADETGYVSPEQLAHMAERCRSEGNIGIAFTYNEPLVGYEYVRDTAAITHSLGMKNVLVTNGTAELSVLEELLPYIDAANIDLKGFTDRYYGKVLGGNRAQTMKFIERAAGSCHVELTTLVIPGENDTHEEMRELCGWVAGLDRDIPLHISRFFPRFHMTDRAATDVSLIYSLADTARGYLSFVYTGNC